MMDISKLIKTGDWKGEKHVPVIEAPEKIKKGEEIEITVSIGKEIPHPNKPEHHIAWIDIFFLPENSNFPIELGRFEFNSHGYSEGTYTEPVVKIKFKTEKSGTIIAVSYCNIHGLWQSSKELKVE